MTTTTAPMDKLQQTTTLRKIVESRNDLAKAATLIDELLEPIQKQLEADAQMLKLLSAPQPPKWSWQ